MARSGYVGIGWGNGNYILCAAKTEQQGLFLSRTIFYQQLRPLGKILTKEKMAKKSKVDENTYVN